MTENLFEAQYDITKKSKLRKFYEKNKILIFSSVLILIIFTGSLNFYLKKKENKNILLSENYVQAKIYLENGNTGEALNLLESGVLSNDPAYSTLCLFLILNERRFKNAAKKYGFNKSDAILLKIGESKKLIDL